MPRFASSAVLLSGSLPSAARSALLDRREEKGRSLRQTALTSDSKTCLIIDDDPDFASFVQKVAQGAGLEARVLTDPLLVEQSLEATDPVVITLDMDMPGRNSLAVLEELAVSGLDERVIIISGNPPAFVGNTRPLVGRMHVHAVLTKPIRKRDLESALTGASKALRVSGRKAMQLFLLIVLASTVDRIPYRSEAMCQEAAKLVNERSTPVYAICIPAEPIAVTPDREGML